MTYTIQNILYATDLGDHEPEIFRHAAGLARQFGATVHIIHALEPIGEFAHSMIDNFLPPEGQEKLREEGFERVREKLHERLDDYCKDALQVHTEVSTSELRMVEGVPTQVILDEAERIGADLIVLGSHGHTALNEMLLGSVARKVTVKSKIPVLLVPVKA
jgi:nucleotide-binding universal stress UspA family protein